MDFFKLKTWFGKHDYSHWYDLADNQKFSYKEQNLFKSFAKLARNGEYPSEKSLKWGYEIIQKKSKDMLSVYCDNGTIRHLTVRMAWHDNKWNGKICKHPSDNDYCIGENSLLSRRIQKNRNLEIENKYKDKLLDNSFVPDYQPPCYWSINAFGNKNISFEHENPAAPNIKHKKELLKKYSVFSWPFKLSFVHDEKEKKNFGTYFPDTILRKKIENFNSKFKEKKTIVFLYLNYDNPISGEDKKYCIAGCAFLKSIGELSEFDVKDDELQALRNRPNAKNFPKIVWSIQYSLDLPDNGFRLPYQEYIDFALKQNMEDNFYLDEIKVIIEEREIEKGFKYVAMDIGNDESIFVLMKIYRSLLKIKGHNILSDYDVNKNIQITKKMLTHCWKERGFFPGMKSFLMVFIDREKMDIEKLYNELIMIKFENMIDIVKLYLTYPDKVKGNFSDFSGLFYEIHDRMQEEGINAVDFLKLSMLNLSVIQFERILNKEGIDRKLKDIADNPYLLYEEYKPADYSEDLKTDDRIDGEIDLYKIDMAFFPDLQYTKKKISEIQNMHPDDPIRMRALIIKYLKKIENDGDSFTYPDKIENFLKNYPLFYKSKKLKIRENLSHIPEQYKEHFAEKIVIKENSERTFYYLKEIYEAEQYIKEKIIFLLKQKDLRQISNFNYNKNIDASVKELSKKIKNFDEALFRKERKMFYQNILKKRVYVVTGSPGAGKSFEVMSIANILNEQSKIINTGFYAPTGKAVLRIKNNERNFNFSVMTIAKFLQRKNDSCPYKNIIIDEMSMVNLRDLYDLFCKIDFNKVERLILVGDKNQLPPIGVGKPFMDIINYMQNNDNYKDNVISFESNCRFEDGEFLINFAQIFSSENKNYEETLCTALEQKKINTKGNNFHIYFWENRDELREQILKAFMDKYEIVQKDNLPDFFLSILGIKEFKNKKNVDLLNLDKFQIITPYRMAFYGTMGINNFIHKNFIESDDIHSNKLDFIFKEFDKIIQTENYYKDGKLFLSNGSIGLITNEAYYFKEGKKTINLSDLQHNPIELAYAITVHKSQGTGFGDIFVIIPYKQSLLSRELLYTALTRAKKSVTLFVYDNENNITAKDLLNKIRLTTFAENRKTSIFTDPFIDIEYQPSKNIKVRSRVEYIIYKKLIELQTKFGDTFEFQYEQELVLEYEDFNLKPDFTIRMVNDDSIVYWEHLGMLSNDRYKLNWKKKYNLYREHKLEKNLVTTDELNGIHDEKIEIVIEDIINGRLKGNTQFSLHHYAL